MAVRRFPIYRSLLWRPFLLFGGVVGANSYAEIEEGQLYVKYGWLFDARIPLEEIVSVDRIGWPFWAYVGRRTFFSVNSGSSVA